MAQKIVLLDDLDGSEAAESLTFALDGASYAVDLNQENAQELRDMLAPYIKVARPVRQANGSPKYTKKPVNSKRKVAHSGPTDSEVRAWARKRKISVNPTGRVPNRIKEQFLADN